MDKILVRMNKKVLLSQFIILLLEFEFLLHLGKFEI